MIAAIPLVRRLVLTTLATGLGLLGACGRDQVHGGDSIGMARHELVAEAEHYVGAVSMAPKQIALTFDDGPGARTSELSTYLKGESIRAVFFVNGACVHTTTLTNNSCGTPTPNATTILAQLAADGHLVANHTTTHRDLVSEVPANERVRELSETDALITAHGKTPWNRSLFRAPYGSWNATVYNTLSTSAMKHYVGPVYWDIGGGPTDPSAAATMAADWECWQELHYTTEQCAERYLNEVNSVGRGIVLMHDAHSQTIDMVKYLVPRLKNAGYTFVRADEIPVIAQDLPACGGTGCVTCAGPGAAQCTSCSAGRYLSGGTCNACSTCALGTYLAAACTATSNTVCTPCDSSCATCTGAGPAACTSCAAGKYLSGGACKTCSTCAPGTYPSAACTGTADTVCAACDPSCTTCSGPSASDCGTCPSGFFLDGGTCKACTVCEPGTYAAAACSASADTACTACPSGTYAPAPGASACTSCESCDDGDACTIDACSATAGCTHAPVPGCSSGTPEASDGSGTSDSSGTASGSSSGVPIDDAGESNGGIGGGGGSGCDVGRSASAPSASSVVALAALALFGRRRRGCARG